MLSFIYRGNHELISILMLWSELNIFEMIALQFLMHPLLKNRYVCQLSDPLSDNIQVVLIHFTRGDCKKTGTSTCPNLPKRWFSCDIYKTVGIWP